MRPNVYVDDTHVITARQAAARSNGVSYETIRKRLERGWPIERAMTVPTKIRTPKPLHVRLQRRTLRDAASSALAKIYAERLALWANWRGPVAAGEPRAML